MNFTVSCTARAEVDGQSVPLEIEWARLLPNNISSDSNSTETSAVTTGTPESGYQSILTASEDGTDNDIIYRCRARAWNDPCAFSHTTVCVDSEGEF